MKLNFKDIDNGTYLVFYDNDIDLNLFLEHSKDNLFVNFGTKNSIKVNPYFRTNKLRFSSNLIKSFSNAPQEIFSVVVDLIKNNKDIFMGTAGLSYDSIAEIYLELKNLLQDTERRVFIFYQRKIKKGEYEIFDGNLLNKYDIVDLFLNS
jgi:hypothetical protein